MLVDITGVLELLIRLGVVVVIGFVIPYIKSKLTKDQIDDALQWINIAVAAAEQLYESTEGEQKKAYVLRFLAAKGVTLDSDEIDKAIEAAVLELHSAIYDYEVETEEE